MGEPDDWMIAAHVCEKFGWTLDQYLDQPQWFLNYILIKMDVEAEAKRKREFAAQQGTKQA